MSSRPGVSAESVVDFDHHSEEFNRDEVRASAEIRRRCPVAWNERYGGFWFVTSYRAVAESARDCATFAHKYEPNAEDGIDYQGELGVPRPPGQPALGVGEIDGPFHETLRRAIARFFSPRAVDRLRPYMEQSANWFLDQHIEDGTMDLLLDYASPVPAILTLRLMGLPYDGWQSYANLFHSTIAFPPGSSEYLTAIAEVPVMMGNLLEFATARRTDPKDDLTSLLVQFEFEGNRLDDSQLVDVIWNLVAGGVDTTTSQTALSLFHLATHPDLRQQLIEHPELYGTATDEYLRYFTINQQLSRTVTADTILGGQQLRRNDKVILSWLAANHDGTQFERPDEVILDRTPNHHLAFGGGTHRCIGAHLAKAMFEVMVKCVLDRIPDYEVDAEQVQEYVGSPAMTGLNNLPTTFTPGVCLGTSRPF
jgi:cytochrome P450